MTDDSEIPPEAGKRPDFLKPVTDPGDKPSDDGFFGETYDSDAQKAWRARQTAHELAPEGIVEGSGTGAGGGQDGEDYADDPATGGTEVVPPGIEGQNREKRR